MNNTLEQAIEDIIKARVADLKRPDLFREPVISYSSADDKRYEDLKLLIGEWHLLPAELLPDAKSVISYFVPFTKDVTRQPKQVEDGSPLWGEAYQEINRHFDNVSRAAAEYLAGAGYSAKTISPTHTYDPENLKCFWSHRSAAAISGLGVFGANKLLITEKGSGGRFCSIITSAVLKTDKNPIENKCLNMKNGSCGLCFKICPVNALTPDSVNKFACLDRLNENEAKLKATTDLQSADACGKCISICPFAYIA